MRYLGADARTAKAEPEDVSGKLQEVPIEWIQPGKYQPRKVIEDEALQELASSIKAQGHHAANSVEVYIRK